MNIEAIIAIVLGVLVVGGGFLRLENRLTKIETDISWIKEILGKCLPTWEKDSE